MDKAHEIADVLSGLAEERYMEIVDDTSLTPAQKIKQMFAILHSMETDRERLTHFNIWKNVAEMLDKRRERMHNILDEYLDTLVTIKRGKHEKSEDSSE